MTYLVPCSAPKAAQVSPARELYTGSTYRLTLAAAEAAAAADRADGEQAQVLIVSARHGLLELDALVAPYDQHIAEAGAVTAEDLAVQLAARQLGTVYCLLPGAYFRLVARAAEIANDDEDAVGEWIAPMDVFEAAPGIGWQRGVAAQVRDRIAA